MERDRLRRLSTRYQQAATAGSALDGATAAPAAPRLLPADCVMPSLDDGCRRAVQAAQAAVAWALAPTVVL